MKSIRSKIILVSCFICIFSILSATIISYKILSTNIKEQTFAKLEEISKRHAVEIEGWISTQARLLNDLYNELMYKNDYNRDKLIEYFNYKNKKNPDVKEYYIAFPDNVFVTGFNIWIPDDDYNVVEREWYKNAIQTDEIAISSPYVDINHGGLIVTFSKAIRTEQGIIGVLAADISVNHIVNTINKSKPLKGGYAFLVDNNGNILAHPQKEFLYSKENGLTNINEIYNEAAILKSRGEGGLNNIIDYNGKEIFLLYNNLEFNGWDIGLAAPVDEVMKPLDNMVYSTIILSIILAIISVVLTFILGNSIAKPIKVATNNVEKMAELDITEDIDKKYLNMKDEIGRMFNAFQMIIVSLREFLSELNDISNKISTFSDELAVLSYKSSIDTDNIVENSANIAEIRDKNVKKIKKLIKCMEDLYNKTNKFTIENNNIKNEEINNQLELINKEVGKLTKELTQTQDIVLFESIQTKDIYSLIGEQRLLMEEISSASQCLAELGEELNEYIAKFKS
ncbi:PDC sensor domain-containing protein [Clostridiisalibacter paucivorans]|uniref:PDC sensor domain-containing protein n=1 Tax=Clostridiisalibacter paucivorans TaxID=408753 RepID=UPI00047D57C8|nr:methyl-accepting chemotaxis protein [Clostridiisalibacter paucivorans]